MTMFLWVIFSFLVLLLFSIKIYHRLNLNVCQSGVHMVGKVVIITGGNSGLGFETAKNLAERGARVIIACRSIHRAEEAAKEIIEVTGNKDIEYRHLDLASLSSVRQFCENILKTEQRVDVLINNAAASGLGNYKTEDGNHIGIQVNYFGSFLITNLLLPLLKSSAPSRIINLSSTLHKHAKIDFENLNMEKYWNDYLVYANSKLYINLMTIELNRRLQGTNVTVNAVHPGIAATNIFRSIKPKIILYLASKIVRFLFLSNWEAAQTTIYLAVSPELQKISGRYFSNCREKKPSKLSQDLEIARKLWKESEKLTKYTPNNNN